MKDLDINLLMELIIKAMPYSEHMQDIEIVEDAVYFSWRSNRFRVNISGSHIGVDTHGDGVLIGDDISILLKALLDKQYIAYLFRDVK